MKIFVIYNPAAGQRDKSDDLIQTTKFLAEQGCEIAGVESTHGEGDATTFARKAVAMGCDTIFVAGGDGTLAQTVDGLVGSDTALAVLPGGTGNVLARQLGLPVPGGLRPHPLLDSAQILLRGRVQPVDVGRMELAGGHLVRHFLCWGGVGFDAQVNLAVNEEVERKHRLGMLAFVVAGARTLRHYAGTAAVVRIDGRRVSRRLLMLVANNIQLYGAFIKMAPLAVLDDGLLDVYCFRGRGAGRTLLHLARLLVSQHIQDPEVDIYRARRIEVRTARPLPVHVDGEPIGYTPIVINVLPRSVKLLIPCQVPASLFAEHSDRNGSTDESAWQRAMTVANDAQTVFMQRSAQL